MTIRLAKNEYSGCCCRRVKQLLEPARLGKCIGVEEREPLDVGGLPDSHVVRRSEPDVLIEADDSDAREDLFELLGRAVDACVVDNHRPLRTTTSALAAAASARRSNGPEFAFTMATATRERSTRADSSLACAGRGRSVPTMAAVLGADRRRPNGS